MNADGNQKITPVLWLLFLCVIISLGSDFRFLDDGFNVFEIGIVIAEIVCLCAAIFFLARAGCRR